MAEEQYQEMMSMACRDIQEMSRGFKHAFLSGDSKAIPFARQVLCPVLERYNTCLHSALEIGGLTGIDLEVALGAFGALGMVLLATAICSGAYDLFKGYTQQAAIAAMVKRTKLYQAYIEDFLDIVEKEHRIPSGEPYEFREWYAVEYLPHRTEMNNRFLREMGIPSIG